MAFELISSDINNLVERRLLDDVTISRHLYRHSTARIVIEWDEVPPDNKKSAGGKRTTAILGASMLDAELSLVWRGKDLKHDVACFKGYVAGVQARHATTRSYIVLDCISQSKRADLIPRYRVWQSCTLLDICQHIAEKEAIFEIHREATNVLGDIAIALSVQFEETDFAYLSRMLHAWGVPMSINDLHGKVTIGSANPRESGVFSSRDGHYDSVTLESELLPVDAKSRNTGQGATGIARQFVNNFNNSLSRDAADYLPRLDDDHLSEREWIAECVYETAFQARAAVYRIEWSGSVSDYSPGTSVMFDDQQFLVRSSEILRDKTSGDVMQELVLQDHMSPLQMHHRRVSWPSRMVWARVTDNSDKDPMLQGRMQVEFDWENLDPTVKENERCWLPTLTPYAGLKGSGNSGFLSLPEIGERVLVQFLGDWDSDAVILGSVREYAASGFHYDPHLTKRWQTPSGNQVTLTTGQDGSDSVSIKCQDKVVFEGKMEATKQMLIFDLFDSDNERIHFEKGDGPARLDIFCGGEIYMHAGQKLLLEGGIVQIKSTSGAVSIDGAPMVMINCNPWSLKPLKLQHDPVASKVPTETKRSKPSLWIARAASLAALARGAKPEGPQNQYVLKDKDTGQPIAHERYRLKLPDGSIREGSTDDKGVVHAGHIPTGQSQVCFPDMDADTWHPM